MVFGIWIPLLVVIGFASSQTGSDFATEFEIPASESNDVQMLLEANNPDRAGFSGEIVFSSPSGVDTDAGGECSSTAIRAIIKKLVDAENARKPLSDSKIADVLADQGIRVARRTIAKYRESLGIAPSNERKQLL